MTVSTRERDHMQHLLNIMEGKASTSPVDMEHTTDTSVELAGPGQITRKDIDAMASVMKKLHDVINQVVDTMITESHQSPQLSEALNTQKLSNGVQLGRYQIMIKEDEKRIAGKQYYTIYNSLTKDVIADDISLYETALLVVRYLNSGKFANHASVRTLFELDETYTSHRIDALRYKRLIKKNPNSFKLDLYESRYQASLDRCMQAKKTIKKLAL